MRRETAHRFLCVALVVFSGLFARAGLAAEPVYRFGVVPQQTATKLARLWIPILALVEKRAGVRLVFETAPDIPEFERRLAQGRYDFAYMNPYHITVFNKAPGYRAFARRKGGGMQGVLVVPVDSPVKDVAELAGETLAFPAPAAFAASVLPRAHLTKSEVPFKAKYVSSHDSVYQSVSKGLFAGGGGIERTLKAMPETVRSRLRILWRSDTYTSHAYAAHPRVPSAVVTAVGAAMVGLTETPDGAAAIAAAGFGDGLTLARDSEWDDIRALGLELLEHLVSGS